MKLTEGDFTELVNRAKSGDEGAVRSLLEHFEPDVRIAVRRRLPRVLRAQFDSMDFVQRVWTSVFAGGELDPTRFDKREHLLGYLNGVAYNKVREEYRRRTKVKKYDLRREEPLYVRRGGRDELRDLPAQDPTPSQDLQREDRLAQLTAGRQPLDAEVIRLRVQGLTFEQISQRTGVHERKARRLIEELKQRLEDEPWL